MANFPTSYDTGFGDLEDLIVLTLNGALNTSATSVTFNETSAVARLKINTELVFGGTCLTGLTFSGTLNDMTLSGTFTGVEKKKDFVVEIDGIGTPNTFKWSVDGGATWAATGVPCSVAPMLLTDGLSVSFGATTGHALNTQWSWSAGFEIVKITANNGAGNLTVTRGFNGSVSGSHDSGAVATQDPTNNILVILRDMLLASQKFAGLVGLDAAKSATPSPGMVYIATDTQKVYVCLVANAWRLFVKPAHADFTDLALDHHTQYHTDARKAAWHAALTGVHLTSGPTHDHSGAANMGNPVKRLQSGPLAARPAAEAVGQVYLATDTSSLYISMDGSTWTQYIVVLPGTIMFFETACPAGWTNQTALNGKFLRGAPAGAWTGLASGGAATHQHALPDVINHTHSVAQQVVTTDNSGSHQHTFDSSNDVGTSTKPYNSGSGGTRSTDGEASHTHTVNVPDRNSGNAGTAGAVSELTSSLPPYKNLIACRKD